MHTNEHKLVGASSPDLKVWASAPKEGENAECVLKILQEHQMKRVILITTPFHQLRTFLTFAKVFQPHGIDILNYYADSGEWHPATWFLSKENRQLVHSEMDRIKTYREKGDLL